MMGIKISTSPMTLAATISTEMTMELSETWLLTQGT